MDAMQSLCTVLTADPGPPIEPPVQAFRDPIQQGAMYRLPSGRCASVTSVGGANITLQYQDAVTLRRDALARLGRRVLGAGAEPPG
jgi:hypothetical protein